MATTLITSSICHTNGQLLNVIIDDILANCCSDVTLTDIGSNQYVISNGTDSVTIGATGTIVVSGDANNLLTAGSDGGALLLAATICNTVAANCNAAIQLLGGTTLRFTDNNGDLTDIVLPTAGATLTDNGNGTFTITDGATSVTFNPTPVIVSADTGNLVQAGTDGGSFFDQDDFCGWLAGCALGDLGDVDVTGIQVGDIMSWDGTEFLPVANSSVAPSNPQEVNFVNPANPSAAEIALATTGHAYGTLYWWSDQGVTSINDATYIWQQEPDGSLSQIELLTNLQFSNNGCWTLTVGVDSLDIWPKPAANAAACDFANEVQYVEHQGRFRRVREAPTQRIVTFTSTAAQKQIIQDGVAGGGVFQDNIIFIDATQGDVTFTLVNYANPDLACDFPYTYRIKRIDTTGNDVFITGQGGELVDGLAAFPLNTPGPNGALGESIEVTYFNNAWYVL